MKRMTFVLGILGLASLGMGQIPLDSIRGPVCGMLDPATKIQVAISPVFTRVNVVVTDAIAQAVVTQTFVNPFKAPSEVIYMFPLPDQGAVHGMKYQYRDSLYTARIMDRAKAQAIYDSIKQSGGQAALLIQERPNIFMQRMASIGAGETAYVEIRLSMVLKYADGELELAFPTRIGPRYPSGAGTPGSWNPPEDREGPGFQFNVLLQSGVDLSAITSPSHPIDIGEIGIMKNALVERKVMGPEAKVTAGFSRGILLKTATTYPNRDFVLRMKRAKTANDFSLASYRDAAGSAGGIGQGHFVLNLYPDPTLFEGTRPDLELVMLVDVSGSQQGWPLEREKEISLNILSRLTARDDLTVLSFSDAVNYAFGSQSPVPASRANISTAENFVRGLGVQGGTQLLNAVNACLAVPRRTDKKRYYVFLTDGFITDEKSILEAIRNHPSQPTIFTFGAGNSLNRYFLEECAKVGNGFATPMVQGDAVGPLVEIAWSRIEVPQLENIQVDFGGLEVSEEIFPVSRKLYRGLPYLVMGKYRTGGTYTVTLSADRDGKPISFSRTLTVAGEESLSWSVPKLWAREKIGRLVLDQGTTTVNKAAIIQVSVEYQVLSQYTAFLASNPQAVTRENDISTSEIRKDNLLVFASRFDLAVRGGFLFLDWMGGAPVQAIRIYDMHGRLLFVYRPGAGQVLSRWVWDGRDAKGRILSRGRYLVTVQTAHGARTRAFEWDPRP